MARYEVTGPDGAKYQIEAPDSMSEAQVLDYFQKQFSDRESKAAAQLEADRKLYDPTVGMSGTEKFLAGVGKAMTDLGRGAGQMVGLVDREDVAESRKRDAALMNTGAGMAGNLVGNVAAAVPTAFIPGANTITGAGLIGAGYGLLQPSTSTAETLKNTAVGGVASAAVPAAIRALQVGRSFVEPLYEGGRNRIIGRALNQTAGGHADDAIRNLRNAHEFVPGSRPTAGEAAGVPSLAALQRTATATSPNVANEATARQLANNDARIAFLQSVTPNPAEARAARQAAAGPMYDAARGAGFDPQITETLAPQIQSLMQRVPDDLVNQARQLAQVAGDPVTDMGSVQGAHYLKKAIDSRISQAVRSGDAETARVFSGLQRDYLDVLDQLNPAYQQARQTFASMSPPINQGEVLEEVGRRATNFRGEMTPAAFARAIQDRTAAGVTGMPNATMQGTLTPTQNQALQAIRNDLLRSDFAQTAGRGVGSDTVQKLAYSNMLSEAGVPSILSNLAPAGVVGNIAQRAGNVIYRDANERMAQRMAEALMNPAETATLMEGAQITPEMIRLVNALRRGGTALGGATAGSVQALQQ